MSKKQTEKVRSERDKVKSRYGVKEYTLAKDFGRKKKGEKIELIAQVAERFKSRKIVD